MLNLPESCFPQGGDLLLLKAALLDEGPAREAWCQYQARYDIDKVADVSMAFLPMIYKNLKIDSQFPKAFSVCKNVYLHLWARNTSYFMEFKRLLLAFSEKSLDICLLKGAALLLAYYEDLGLRLFGDIDVLLPEEQVMEAVSILKSQCWTPFVSHYPSTTRELREAYLLSEMGFEKNEVLKLDLHWQVYPLELYFETEDFGRFAVSKRTFFSEAIEVYLPSSESLLQHVLLHGIYASPVPLWRWIPDAVYILRKSPHFNWVKFFESCDSYGHHLMIKKALLFLHDHQFWVLPIFVRKRLAKRVLNPIYHFYFYLVCESRCVSWLPGFFKGRFIRHFVRLRWKNPIWVILSFPFSIFIQDRRYIEEFGLFYAMTQFVKRSFRYMMKLLLKKRSHLLTDMK